MKMSPNFFWHYSVIFFKNGRFLQILWPSPNIWTLLSHSIMTKNTRKQPQLFFEIEQVFYCRFSFLIRFMKFSGHINFFRDFFFCYWRFVLAYCQKKNPEEKRPGLNYSWFTQLTYLICGYDGSLSNKVLLSYTKMILTQCVIFIESLRYDQ